MHTYDEDVMSYDQTGSSMSSAGYFFLGLGVGAAVAMLFAPRSGAETRQAISDGVNTGSRWVTDKSREVADKASKAMSSGREMLQHRQEQVAAAVDAGRQAYREATSRHSYQGGYQEGQS
ncbi:MAG: YtxH domain-containing protein [Bryobacterales bacterium]|nr:YtxH domain-containing protein [Bryobacterales bacterium]